MGLKKRKHPSGSFKPNKEESLPIMEEPTDGEKAIEDPQERTDKFPKKPKRPHPPGTSQIDQKPEYMDADNFEREPLSKEEREGFETRSDDVNEPLKQQLETPPFLKRTIVFLLVLGFGLLGFFFLLQIIQAIDAIFRWPPVLAWPLVVLIFILIGYAVVRLGVLLFRLRALQKIHRGGLSDPRHRDESERKMLRAELVKHLNIIAKQESDSNPSLARNAQKLIGDSGNIPSTAWLEQYNRKIQEPLAEAAARDVRKIALAAGVSAAFSPWRLLDTLIALNASVEAAQCTLRRFGIRPDSTATMAFAFDTFLTTFFAAAVDEISEDLAKDLQERLGGEFAGNAVGYLGPKLAQGIGIAYFVRRLGRRMIRRLEAVKLSK